MTTPTPDAAAALQAANARADRYLAVLWKYGWREGNVTTVGWVCEECYETGNTKAAVQHLPGCVFAGLDAATVAALEADWTPG